VARAGIVRRNGVHVGTIEEVDEGRRIRFTYLPEWLSRADARPISLTLPLQSEPYDSETLHPFFANLLPEGWLLNVSTRRLKISADDPFGLLLATCADCIGAVEVEALESRRVAEQ